MYPNYLRPPQYILLNILKPDTNSRLGQYWAPKTSTTLRVRSGFGFRVEALGFRVEVLRFRILDLGFRPDL